MEVKLDSMKSKVIIQSCILTMYFVSENKKKQSFGIFGGILEF